MNDWTRNDLLHGIMDARTGESLNRKQRAAYEQSVLGLLKDQFVRLDPSREGWLGFALSEPTLLRARGKGTRLVVPFTSDRLPSERFKYWQYLWENVAWLEWYGGDPDRILPGRIASDFVVYMDLHLREPHWDAEASEPDDEGTRWLRAQIVWV